MAKSDHRNPGPSTEYAAITPSNSAVLSNLRAIYVGGSGNLTVKAPGVDTAVTFSNLPSGTVLPICAEYVMATGTTATLLVGMY